MLVEFRAFVRVVEAVAMGWCHTKNASNSPTVGAALESGVDL